VQHLAAEPPQVRPINLHLVVLILFLVRIPPGHPRLKPGLSNATPSRLAWHLHLFAFGSAPQTSILCLPQRPEMYALGRHDPARTLCAPARPLAPTGQNPLHTCCWQLLTGGQHGYQIGTPWATPWGLSRRVRAVVLSGYSTSLDQPLDPRYI
jgi:hypothetical protein